MRVGAFAAARHVPETPSYKPIVDALMPHTFAEVRVGCRQTVVRGRVDPSTARYLCACSTLGWARAHVSPDTRACWMLHRLCCGRLGLPLRSSRAWSRLDRSRPSLAPVEIVIAVELVVVAVPVEPVVAFAAVEGVVASPTLDDVVALAAESLVRSRCPDEDVVARGSPGDLVTACAQMAFWGELTYGSEVAYSSEHKPLRS